MPRKAIRWSDARKAARRNRAAARRNAKKSAKLPLFAAAGLLDQVVRLEDETYWNAQRVAYFDLAAGIESYERHCQQERRYQQQYAVYIAMLTALIGAENVEEVESDYRNRWQSSTFRSPMTWPYRLNHLCRYIAEYTNRLPLDVYREAQSGLGGKWH